MHACMKIIDIGEIYCFQILHRNLFLYIFLHIRSYTFTCKYVHKYMDALIYIRLEFVNNVDNYVNKTVIRFSL